MQKKNVTEMKMLIWINGMMIKARIRNKVNHRNLEVPE